ncbi:cytochrome P450 (plasmid) [Rhizobium rosettiformans]|uniref:Cytochrome P450 n=1 Tax=Rhizobium rosettiformans TaxID=1368430 RepID=A0ABX7F5D8_9HYPH|nr:cytochrome P450 [Rhizobium rosettiformans]QRF54576.1 cytochrome P450 [Rhizobium rosettiformans]
MGPIIRTPTAQALFSLVRNPLEAVPPSIFTEPLVFSKTAGRVTVWIADPVLVQEALVKSATVLGKGDQVRRALGPALGQGLLTADGAHWKWQRQSVASAFRPASLEALQPAMILAAEDARDRLLNPVEGTADIGHEMMRTTFDIIVETMMSGGHGLDVGRVEQSITDYLEPSGWTFALGVMGAPHWMPYPGRGKAMAAVRFLRTSLARVIDERRRGGKKRHDLVSMLLSASDPETGRTMSDDEMVDNLMTLITAGHETTALGLAWTFDLLSRHPDIEQKVVNEIAQVSAGNPITAEHMPLLAYTRQVFSEAMRLYPPAPIITRTALKDFRLGAYLIPAGTVLLVPIYAVHRHALIWRDAERFDPDRFAPEATKERHRFAYMPFGAGPRVCIGSGFALMEAVAVLAVVLQKLSLTSVATQPPVPLMKVTLRPRTSLVMTVRRR